VKRNSIMIGLLAALVLMVGGLYATQGAYACDNACPAHAKAKVENTTDAGASAATEATVQTADAKVTSGASCCAAGKTATAQMTGAGASCSASADAKSASAGKSCSAEGMKTASEHAACASKEVWSAEATLCNLAHCGIDINKCDVEVLSAKLAEHGCGSFTKEQWASMISSARALDAKQAETILASAKNEKVCAADACPMSQVAKELAAVETKTDKN
jgi:hypothetical protein